MIISSIQKEVGSSSHPVAKAVHKTLNAKAICIGFTKGMELKEHKAHMPTTLLVLNGSINYKEGEKELNLNQFQEYEIPVEVSHAVYALEDSLILLIQG